MFPLTVSLTVSVCGIWWGGRLIGSVSLKRIRFGGWSLINRGINQVFRTNGNGRSIEARMPTSDRRLRIQQPTGINRGLACSVEAFPLSETQQRKQLRVEECDGATIAASILLARNDGQQCEYVSPVMLCQCSLGCHS